MDQHYNGFRPQRAQHFGKSVGLDLDRGIVQKANELLDGGRLTQLHEDIVNLHAHRRVSVVLGDTPELVKYPPDLGELARGQELGKHLSNNDGHLVTAILIAHLELVEEGSHYLAPERAIPLLLQLLPQLRDFLLTEEVKSRLEVFPQCRRLQRRRQLELGKDRQLGIRLR